jgi:hypothetical protein
MDKIEDAIKGMDKIANSAHKKKLLYRLKKEELDKIVAKLKTESAQVAILNCIKACAANSERLSEDAKNVSKPSNSALLEISMEEACKAATLSIFYIRFYNLTKLENLGNFTGIKKIPIDQHINMINSMFLSHEFKGSNPVIMGVVSEIGKEVYDEVMPEHLQKRGVTGEKATEIINEAKALLDSFVIESIPSRIKERGFYVDFDFNELKLSLPTEATEKDSTILQDWISVYLDVVKEFLEYLEKES